MLVAGAHVALLLSLFVHVRVPQPSAPPRPRAESPLQKILQHARETEPTAFRKERQAAVATHDMPTEPRPSAEGDAARRRFERGVDRYRRAQYGADLAAIMRLPRALAWRALESLTLEGDAGAAAALVELAGECERENVELLRSDPFAQTMARGLPDADSARVRSGLQAEAGYLDATRQACRAGGFGYDRLRELVAARGGAIDPDPGLIESTRTLNAFQATFMQGRAQELALDASLLDAIEREAHAGGSIDIDRFFALIDKDALALEELMGCLVGGCSGADPTPLEDRLPLSERAAQRGAQLGIADMIDHASSTGDLVAAYAWADFGAWLADQGCGFSAGVTDFAERARQREALRVQLTAAQLAQARDRAAELVAQYGPGAIATQGCAE